MGCCESASQKQYKLDMHNVIAKHRDVMRGLRMSEKDMEVLYELHLHFCELDHPGSKAGELDLSGLMAGCRVEGESPYLRRMFKIYDTDGSGELGFREFVLGVWSLLSLDREDLAGFSFFLYDHDYNGHLELSELMNILNDVHGEGLANPNGRSASTPHYTRAVQHFQAFSKKKHGSTRHLTVEGKAKECYVTIGEFVTFTKNTPSLLWPAFRLQTDLRKALGGEKFWNSIGARRKQAKINTMAWMQRLKELAAKRSADDGNAGASAGGAVRVTRVQDSSVTGRQRQGNVRRVAPSS